MGWEKLLDVHRLSEDQRGIGMRLEEQPETPGSD
jgi:hypothetical protein